MRSHIAGKALLVITRLSEHGESNRFEVHSFIQHCSGDWLHRDCANEEFQHLEYDVLPLPNAAYRLAPGATLRVAVSFVITYTGDHYDEVDVDLDYYKQRTLRIQKPRDRYISKGARK
jgi:hypothetical protein